ncbi:MAG: TraG/TraD/VirD4 family protein, partial [Succinivibrio sp.]|nr:TraG/TraD/VirD4 family protein [Succinivibrio sp.]
ELQSFDNLFEFQNLKRKISVFIDEASEIANEPMLQLLNKSRGAEVNITLAPQSYADLVKRTGSVSSARQIIANCNTKFSLRVKDDETARVFTNELQYTSIYQKANAIGQNSLSEAITGTDNNSYSKRQTQAELFPPSVLSSLPDFEYVAKLSDGRFVKGVFPILDVESEFGELDDKNNKTKKKPFLKTPWFLSKSMMVFCFQSIVVVKVLMYCIKTLTYPFYKFLIFPIIYPFISPFISPFIRSSKKKRMVKRKVKVTRRYRKRYKKHSIYYLKGYEYFQDNLAFSKAYAKKLGTYDYKDLQDLKAPVASHQFRLKVANNSVSYKITHLDQVEIIEQGFKEFLKQQQEQDNNNLQSTGINFASNNDAKDGFAPQANAEKTNTLTHSTLNGTKLTQSDFTTFMQSTFKDHTNCDDHDDALPFIEHDKALTQAQEQVQARAQTKVQDQSTTIITDHNKAQLPTEFFDLKPSQVQDNLNQNEDVQNLRSLDDKNLEENDIDGNRTSNTNTADTNTNDNTNAPAPAPAPAPASNLVINDMDLQVLNDVKALQGLNDSKDSLRENFKSSLKSSLKDTFKENLELFKANQDHNSPQETKTCNLSSSNDTNFSSKDPKSFDAKLSAMRETQNCVDSSCSKTCNGCCVPDSSSNSDKEDLHYPQNNSKSSYTADNFDAQGQGQDQENEFDYETFISSLSDDDKAYLSRQAVAATYSHPSSLFKYELKDPLSESNGCNDLKKALAKATLATLPIDKTKSKDPENYVSVNQNPVNVDPKDLKTQNTCSSNALTRENRDKDKLQDQDPISSFSKAVATRNANATLQSKAIFKACPWSNNEFNLDLFKARFNSSKTKLIQRYHTLNKLNILFYSLLSSSVNQGFTNEPYIKLSSKSQIKRFETNLCKPIFQRFGLTKSITFTLDTNLNKENNYVQRNLNYRISSAKCNCTFTTSSYLNHPKLDTAISDDFDKNQRQVKIDLYKSFASLQQVKKVLLKDFALK